MDEAMRKLEPVAPFIDDAEKGTLSCPKCGKGKQRENRKCCMYCGYPFSEDRQCQACGTLLTETGLCEACGKTYRRIEAESIARNNIQVSDQSKNEQKELSKKEKARRLLNIDPAKPFMIISLICSFAAAVLFFLPTITERALGTSFKVLDVFDADNLGLNALLSMFTGNTSNFFPMLIALLGLIAAIAMPINNLISFVKNNPMRRGRILYDAIVDPIFVALSIIVAKSNVVPVAGDLAKELTGESICKINAAGWICIALCGAVLTLGIISNTRLKDQDEALRPCLPANREKDLKKKSREKVLVEIKN